MGWWKAFDRGEAEAELDLIADLGLSLVRIFLLWEDIQPTYDTVSPTVAGRPRDRRRHRGRARPRARRHVLHRAHERAELGAAMAARRRPARAGSAAGHQRHEPGRRSLSRPVQRPDGDRGRHVAAPDRRAAPRRPSCDLGVEPRQRAGPLLAARRRRRRAGMGPPDRSARSAHTTTARRSRSAFISTACSPTTGCAWTGCSATWTSGRCTPTRSTPTSRPAPPTPTSCRSRQP